MMEPTRWLVDHAHLLPSTGDALDVACGSGRNAFWLAARGLRTVALDRDAAAIAGIRETAERLRPAAARGRRRPGNRRGDVARRRVRLIVVVHYLHRPLFPALKAALRPGGILVYETFTRGQAQRGKPTNPAFLLEPGELRELVAPLEMLVEREGDFEGKMLASVIAVRP